MSEPHDTAVNTRILTVFFIVVSVLTLVLDQTIVAAVASTIAAIYYIARWSDVLSQKLKPVTFTCVLAVIFAAYALQAFLQGHNGLAIFGLFWAVGLAFAAWYESGRS